MPVTRGQRQKPDRPCIHAVGTAAARECSLHATSTRDTLPKGLLRGIVPSKAKLKARGTRKTDMGQHQGLDPEVMLHARNRGKESHL